MSQQGKFSDNINPAGDVETLTGNSGGAVGPDSSANINILGTGGVTVTGDPGTNTLTISIQNGVSATTSTVDATPTTIITVTFLASPAQVYYLEAVLTAFNASTPAGAGYTIKVPVRSTGVAATIIGSPVKDVNEEAALAAADVSFLASGNSVQLVVTGVAATNINWYALLKYSYG